MKKREIWIETSAYGINFYLHTNQQCITAWHDNVVITIGVRFGTASHAPHVFLSIMLLSYRQNIILGGAGNHSFNFFFIKKKYISNILNFFFCQISCNYFNLRSRCVWLRLFLIWLQTRTHNSECVSPLHATYDVGLVVHAARLICVPHCVCCFNVHVYDILPFHLTSHPKHQNNCTFIGINGVSNFIRLILSEEAYRFELCLDHNKNGVENAAKYMIAIYEWVYAPLHIFDLEKPYNSWNTSCTKRNKTKCTLKITIFFEINNDVKHKTFYL